MEKRICKEYVKYQENVTGYILFYFVSDTTHEVLSTNSLLLPSDFNYDNARVKDTVILKHDVEARIVAKSFDKADILLFQKLLERRIERSEGQLNVTDDSFNFLNQSIPEVESRQEISQRTVDSDSSREESEIEDDTQTQGPNNKGVLHKCAESGALDGALDYPASTNDKIDRLTDAVFKYFERRERYEKQSLKIQQQIWKELRYMRKASEKKDDTPIDPHTLEPVLYEGKNLTAMGDRKMEPTVYGQLIARELFSDKELEESMLFPVRDGGRPALSPKRSELLRTALTNRFQDDNAVADAIASINQLGNDLKRGRRKRKANEPRGRNSSN